MNFLAHIYLSGLNERIQIGNFMGDGMRGTDYKNFHTDIQIGVLLHRSIDNYTDFHPVFRESKHRFAIEFNHFSGIITDMVYDHFLAKDWEIYHHESLKAFVQRFYKSLTLHQEELNLKTKQLLPYLVKQNWLERYGNLTDLEQILGQMDQRFPLKSNMKKAVDYMYNDYELYQREFHLFFKDLMVHSEKELHRLQENFK